jgi:hypothetical protein
MVLSEFWSEISRIFRPFLYKIKQGIYLTSHSSKSFEIKAKKSDVF